MTPSNSLILLRFLISFLRKDSKYIVVEVTMTILRFLKNKNLSLIDSAENTMLSIGWVSERKGTIFGKLGGKVLLVFEIEVVSVVEGEGARFHVGFNVQIIIITLELKVNV